MKEVSQNTIESVDIKGFQDNLLRWFEAEQRDLPWRKDQDPYKVWVSEIMLQQTRVDTVIPYFHHFIEQFPTIKDLSEADEEKVLKAWEGLGYYSRARNLQAAVREVHEKYGGKVPDTPKVISSLKGVGPYTAGAILSIAYGIPEPAVDGNVMRVLSRILSIWDDIAKPSSRKTFESSVRKLISHENPSHFNQALMELGALICTPTSPSCLLCPVREHCTAFYEGTQHELPVKTKTKKQRNVQLASAVLIDDHERILIHKRPGKGLLANLWEFPMAEINIAYVSDKEQMKDVFSTQFGAKVEIQEMTGQIEHVFSHLTWNINVYKGKILKLKEEKNDLKLVSLEEIKEFPFPVSHQKIWKQYLESRT